MRRYVMACDIEPGDEIVIDGRADGCGDRVHSVIRPKIGVSQNFTLRLCSGSEIYATRFQRFQILNG